MIRMISGAPMFIGSSWGRWHRRCYAGGVCGSGRSRMSPGRSAVAGPGGALRGRRLRRLDLLEHGADLAVEGRDLATQPRERGEDAVPDRAEDDEGEDGDAEPHEQEHGPTLTGVAGRGLGIGQVPAEGR